MMGQALADARERLDALVERAERRAPAPPRPPVSPRRRRFRLWLRLAGLVVLGVAVYFARPAPPAPRRAGPALVLGFERELQVQPVHGPSRRLPLPGRLRSLAALPDGSRAYAAVEGVQALLVLDAVRLSWLEPLPLPCRPQFVRVGKGGRLLGIQGEGGEALTVLVDPEHRPWTPTSRCERLTDVPAPPAEPGPDLGRVTQGQVVAGVAGGASLWVVTRSPNRLVELDPAGRLRGVRELAAEPCAVTWLAAYAEPLL